MRLRCLGHVGRMDTTLAVKEGIMVKPGGSLRGCGWRILERKDREDFCLCDR